MKRLIVQIALLLCSLALYAEGWPSHYGGVMLQGFYWDSYQDTQWTNLQAQADNLAPYFDLIWVPQSGYCNTLENQMGYAPIWWFDHKSAFGTEAELRNMIQTFKNKGTGIIEDVVINHRSGNTNWCDFPTETWNGHTMTWSLADICQNDDGGYTRSQEYALTGNDDTGDDFGGSRDLDHTSVNVQNNIKLYLDFLLQDLGYIGFRYDMVKGYAPSYIKLYNEHAHPTYSVGEYWDSNADNVQNWINGTNYQSAAFDFPLKYAINEAFNNGNWTALSNKGLAGNPTMSRFSITFIDNHDTFRTDNGSNDKLHNNILAANAFILALPGTPCIFYQHWKWYETELKKMITARKKAGINNESKIIVQEQREGGYVTIVQGTNAKIMVISGYINGLSTEGWEPVSIGSTENPNYAFYISTEKIPQECTYIDGKPFAYVEVAGNFGETVMTHAWNGADNLTGNWPGQKADYITTLSNGNKVYRWQYNTTDGKTPSNIIFNNGNGGENNQTRDLVFINGGYYKFWGTSEYPDYVVSPSRLLFDREFVAGRKATICLPFNIAKEEMNLVQGRAYSFTGNDNGILSFTPTDHIDAGKPYLFIATQTGKPFAKLSDRTMLNVDAKQMTQDNYTFIGTQSYQHLVSNDLTTYYGYRESDGTFVKVGTGNGAHINTYRAYFSVPTGGMAPMGIRLEGEQTGITKTDLSPTNVNYIYSIDGRLLRKNGNTSGLAKGIYIMNGRKLMVK